MSKSTEPEYGAIYNRKDYLGFGRRLSALVGRPLWPLSRDGSFGLCVFRCQGAATQKEGDSNQ